MVFYNPFGGLDFEPGSLAGGIRDDVIRTLLSDPYFADFSQAGARGEFRQAGFRFRDSVFNSIFNEVVGLSALPKNIVRLGENTIPDIGYFKETETKLPSRYRYIIEYDWVDPFSNKERRSWITVDTNRLDTIGNTLNEAEDYIINTTGEQYPDEILGARVRAGYINPNQ
jgi:hypothetical protein